MSEHQPSDSLTDRVLRGFGSIAGVDPSDPAALQLTLMVASSGIMASLAIVWGTLYFIFDEPRGVAVVWGYASVTFLSVALLRFHARFDLFRFTQLLLTVLLPFVLMLALGGFAQSSAVVVWALMGPLGALLFTTRRAAAAWLMVFLAEVVAGVFLEPAVARQNNLPDLIKNVFFAMNIVLPTATAFVLLTHFVRQKDMALDLLEREEAETRRLLLNVLPVEIADELKSTGHTRAQSFDSVSVLFADIVGFTQLSNELSPAQMVALLNDIFSGFDDIAEHYDVEKIRTIGDNYMCAAGVPVARRDHAETLVSMALDMTSFLDSRNLSDATDIRFRIGINSGPAVAGVVGHKKFQYDIWGDSVNIASRMESHGVPGRIQVARGTYERIKHRFDCEPRGAIDIKNKGSLETWLVVQN